MCSEGVAMIPTICLSHIQFLHGSCVGSWIQLVSQWTASIEGVRLKHTRNSSLLSHADQVVDLSIVIIMATSRAEHSLM
jgi:hypothetical protein